MWHKNKQNSFLLRHLIFFLFILCKSIISIRKWNFCYCFGKKAPLSSLILSLMREDIFIYIPTFFFRWTYITIKRTVCTCLRECVPRSLLLPWSRSPLQQQKNMMRKGSEFRWQVFSSRMWLSLYIGWSTPRRILNIKKSTVRKKINSVFPFTYITSLLIIFDCKTSSFLMGLKTCLYIVS